MVKTSQNPFGIIKTGRKSAAAATAEALRNAILSGDLLMGQPLNETALCESLDVSRTPLREALLELEGQGLVEMLPYKGTQVFSLNQGQIAQLGEFRSSLELSALCMAMERAPEALADALQEINDEAEAEFALGQFGNFGRIDTRIHDCIISYSGNQYLTSAYHIVALKLAVLRMLVQRDAPTMQRSHDDHKDLLKHIKLGHKEEAKALLSRHIDGGTNFYAEKTEPALQLRLVQNQER